jgi:signal transduction histidine kinase
MNAKTHQTNWMRIFAATAGSLAAVLGITVLTGWYTHNITLIQIHPAFVPMQYNTAMGFLLGGFGLLAFVIKRPYLAMIVGGVVATLGGLTLVEYIFDLELGIDQLVMEHYVLVKTSHPGRMAPNTALCFLLAGIAIMAYGIFDTRHRRYLVTLTLGAAVLGLGVIALSGYIVDLESAYGWGHLTRMAVHTSLGFIVLGIGLSLLAFNEEPSERWQTGRQMNIGRRLLAIFLLISLLPTALISVVGLSSSRHLLEETTGRHFKLIALEKTRAIQFLMEAKIREAKTLASHPVIMAAVRNVNTAYAGISDTQIHLTIKASDKDWIDLQKDSSVVQRVLGNELSNFLNKYQSRNPKQYAELFVTDRHGATAGTTKILSDYYQGDEGWWQASFNEGKGAVFIDDRGFDKSVQTIVLGITVPVIDDGKVIGILKMHFIPDNILAIVSDENLDKNEGEGVFLMRSQGTLISSSPGLHHNEEELLNHFEIAVTADGPGWSNSSRHGKESYMGFASLNMPIFARVPTPGARKGISGEKWVKTTWYLFVETMQASATSSIDKLIMIFLILGFIITAVVVSVALVTARSVALPILALKDGAERISKGDLGYRVGTDKNDEVGQLSRAFDMMLDKLNSITASRDELNREIRDREQAELELQKLYRQLVRTNEELENFAYVASHDLKSPLRGIHNLADWLAEDLEPVLNEDAKRHLGLMQNRVARMEGLLDSLLQYSRIGRMEDKISLVDTGQLLSDLGLLLNIPDGIKINIEGGMPVLETSKTPLEIVFRNLIDNAVKHHDKPVGEIKITAREQGNLVEFTVTDDGPGIPVEFQQKIFDIFQTLKPRDEVEGSGMGLAMVKKALERHGGSITLESDPASKRGSSFIFTWPKVPLIK